jgi:hypothetical protein
MLMKYFEDQWIKINYNWYEGAYEGIPSHDNGLESTNRYIKDFHTFRHRLSLSQFLVCLFNLVKNWSQDRNISITMDKYFHESPPIDTRLWTYSFQFAQYNLPIISGKSENLLFKSYYFCSDKKLAICAQFIQAHRKQEWAHFTNYVDWLTEVIKVDVHATDWKLGKCSCSFFKKNYICSHLVGISIRLGLCEAPSAAQTVDVGKHRGVGRPTNVPEKSAWLEQPTNYVSQFTKISSSIATIATTDTIATTATTSDTAVASVAPTASNSEINPPKLRGRPPGSKNKPKKN